MFSGTSVKTPKNQKGVALLVMIIVIILAFSSYIISGFSINQVKTEQKKQTRVILKKAKQALIAYAITYSDRAGNEGEMGYLPCPDWNSGIDEGKSDGNCGDAQTNTVGYFPWVSVDTSIFKDNSGSCLWYAVSGSYKKPNSTVEMINEDSNGLFQIMDAANAVMIGNNSEDRIVAIVFAPTGQLTNQTRVLDNNSFCGKDYGNVSAYLEGNGTVNNGVFDGNADAIDQFIHASNTSATEATPYNDQFITITRDEIWSAILARNDFDTKMQNLTEALALCLRDYATANTGNRLPWVAPMNIVDDTGVVDYRINTNYDDSDGTSGYAGRYPFKVDTSNIKIGVAGVNELFTDAGCNNLAVGSGASANLIDTTSEYRKLWNNWKDHFFYVLSKDYEPEVGAPASNPDDAAVVAAYAAANAAAAAATAANAIADSANIIKDATAAAAAALASGDTAAATAAAADVLSEVTIIQVKEADADVAATAVDVAAAAAITAAAVAGVDPDVAMATVAAANAATDAADAATDAADAAGDAVKAANKVVDNVSKGKISQAEANAADAAVAASDAAAAAAAADVAAALAAAEAAAAEAAAGTAPASCAGNCIKVNGTERAAVVIFAGPRQVGQLRRGPVWLGANPDINTKHLIENYLENGNEDIFPDNGGNDPGYVTGGNDIMFCIDPSLGVSSC